MTAKSGAEVIDGREVDGVSAQRFNVQISVRNNEGSELFESTYLVGADGADSMVLAGLRPGFHRLYALPHLERTALILSEGELDWDAEWTGLILLRHGKGIGRLMVDEQFIRLAVNYDSRRGWQDELAGMTSYLGERFGLRLRGDIVHRISASNRMGVGGNYNLGAGFALLVGEAAGLLDPWGFGIKLALDSGRIAAESLVESAGESITPHIRYRYRMHETLDGLIRQRRKLGDRVGDLETASLSSREGDRVTKRDRRRLRRRFLK
jgi:flavin-dependent dehydrogenase